MNTSVRWINDYLDPPASAKEQGEILTRAGFPLEGTTTVDGDVRQDFEMTSNRGDCVCHLGLAREIAALSARTLKSPLAGPKPTGPKASTITKVTNTEPTLCPRYCARVIRGVRVQPSPDWLADRLRARGDIPRSNVVDATNFVLFEMGQPTHIFDLVKLHGPEIIIRRAKKDEAFLPLGEGAQPLALCEDDLVIADAKRPVALAGVKGGADSMVSASTTDLLLEIATFNPVSVRTTSRRYNITSDSAYRFERGVHPGQLEAAADRLAELILDLAGGELCEETLADGMAIPAQRAVTMRLTRCRKILGVNVPTDTALRALAVLGFQPTLEGDVVSCTVPYHRLDIEREIDLIEEVSRILGHDSIPIAETIAVRAAAPQASELADRAVRTALVGMGFLEATTHSLTGEKEAELFLPQGMQPLRVDDERARATPVLRPSIIPSLLHVHARNRDQGNGDAMFFEIAATFAAVQDGHLETRNLALLEPATDPQHALRHVRGVIDRVVEILLGPDARVEVREEAALPWFEPCAVVRLNGEVLGTYGVLAKSVQRHFDLDRMVIAAELGVPRLYAMYPPQREVQALPSFPAIERDISVVVDEGVRWQQMEALVQALSPDHLREVDFVTTYRGKQIGADRKSVTMRLQFRADDRTLQHEDVDAQIERVQKTLQQELAGEIRTGS